MGGLWRIGGASEARWLGDGNAGDESQRSPVRWAGRDASSACSPSPLALVPTGVPGKDGVDETRNSTEHDAATIPQDCVSGRGRQPAGKRRKRRYLTPISRPSSRRNVCQRRSRHGETDPSRAAAEGLEFPILRKPIAAAFMRVIHPILDRIQATFTNPLRAANEAAERGVEHQLQSLNTSDHGHHSHVQQRSLDYGPKSSNCRSWHQNPLDSPSA